MAKKGRIISFFIIVFAILGLTGATAKPVVEGITLGLDLKGGFEVLYEVKPVNKGDKIDRQALLSAVEALDKRANALGVSEPNIQIEGNDRIRVQLAGVKDQTEARKILSTQAELTFRDVNDKELLNGSDLVQGGAKQSFDQNGKPNVVVELKDAKKFKEVTEKIVKMAPENKLIIWLDWEEGDSYKKEAAKANPKFLSDPYVNEVFDTTTVTIEGQFTVEEAQQLASLLNAGALPVKLHEIYSTSVGAKYGEEAMQSTIYAGYVGVGLIMLFMIFYYRLPGLIASITLVSYIYLILVVYNWMHAVLTLPGIAALILGVGMAVDANIITDERIKDELKLGKSVRSAFKAGNKRSLLTIFDANVTTILVAVVLFIFGTSSVKGFATMLIISIIISFLTAIYLSRLLLGLLVESRAFDKKPHWFSVRKSDILDITKTNKDTDVPTRFDHIDFVKHRKKFFVLSSVLIIAGIILLFVAKLNLSIDFTSGTRVELATNEPLSTDTIEKEFKSIGLKPDEIVLSGNDKSTAVVRFVGTFDKETISNVKEHFTELYGIEPNISTVSPTVGKELARNALIGVAIASIGIIIYVSIRFEFYMALAAVLALLHDAFFIVSFFSITRLEVDITFIAAVLTIIGYSINDTIVTFDRIKENMGKAKKIKTFEQLAEIVNKSLRQTFTRSINTVLTVIFAVVALILFGSSSILNFSIALLVGLIAGVYSSLFIASQLWLVWKWKQIEKRSVKEN
ncbi:protein translocase subunit SecDF [Aeribacillus sp. FSL M8-0254]|uniref:protein translocase subunit SecDF n=1 Tax=Aeribacillus sp. FSL M8-0254 TaxID=2954577 RepID=UPI0030FB0999